MTDIQIQSIKEICKEIAKEDDFSPHIEKLRKYSLGNEYRQAHAIESLVDILCNMPCEKLTKIKMILKLVDEILSKSTQYYCHNMWKILKIIDGSVVSGKNNLFKNFYHCFLIRDHWMFRRSLLRQLRSKTNRYNHNRNWTISCVISDVAWNSHRLLYLKNPETSS